MRETEGITVALTDVEPRDVCCGRLFYAEVVDGNVILQCCVCGKLWGTEPGGRLAPIAPADSGLPSGYRLSSAILCPERPSARRVGVRD